MRRRPSLFPPGFAVVHLAVLGAFVVLLAVAASRDQAPAAPLTVICESGAFAPTAPDAADPYRKAEAACTLTDAHGAAVRVIVID